MKNGKKYVRRYAGLVIFPGLILLVLMSAGCAQKQQPAAPAKENVTITDSLSRTVNVPCPPQRIVSVNNDVSEVSCALGAADKIVGGCLGLPGRALIHKFNLSDIIKYVGRDLAGWNVTDPEKL